MVFVFPPGLSLIQPNPNLLQSARFALVYACMCGLLVSSASVDFLDRSVSMSVCLSLFFSLSSFPPLCVSFIELNVYIPRFRFLLILSVIISYIDEIIVAIKFIVCSPFTHTPFSKWVLLDTLAALKLTL